MTALNGEGTFVEQGKEKELLASNEMLAAEYAAIYGDSIAAAPESVSLIPKNPSRDNVRRL
jgi:hypothetical protein